MESEIKLTKEEIKNRLYILGGHMLNIDMHGWADISDSERKEYNAMRQEYKELEKLL